MTKQEIWTVIEKRGYLICISLSVPSFPFFYKPETINGNKAYGKSFGYGYDKKWHKSYLQFDWLEDWREATPEEVERFVK